MSSQLSITPSTISTSIDPINDFLQTAASVPEPDLTGDLDLITDIIVAETPNGFAELGLVHSILASIEKSGYTTPTPIQAQAIPAAMAGRDLLLSAQTGSGKTAAFVLPILHKIAESKSKSRAVRALILTPTRELAYQVAESIRTYSAGMRDIFCVPLVGGAPYTGQIRALKKGVQIIVATPGRLLDHMNDGRIDFSDLSMLVLDEADRMLDMGFADDISRILEAMPASRQTIMSSATWDGPVGKIAASFTTNPERIAIKVESAHIDEKVYFCDDFNHKNKLLEQLVCDKDLQQAIIFTSTKSSSEQLAERLSEWGHKACYLHGDLPQSKRNRIVADLKAGKYDILVATDVAARGIDVPKISHVFNYDLPRQVEDYVHRIGRSGRAGRTGIAINLCSRDDHSQYHAINRYLKRDMTEATVEGLEPRFIESTYDRSGKGRSGRNGRSNGSNNGGQNRSRSSGYATQAAGGRDGRHDNKYSGFNGDANRPSSRDGARKNSFQKDSFKARNERPYSDRTSHDSNRQDRHSRDDNSKMLTSHEFNFFNETRKSDPHRSYDDRPRKANYQGQGDNRKSRYEGKPQGEYHPSAERSFDSSKSKRFQTEGSYSNGSRPAKSHNVKGFEGRHFENNRKRGEENTATNSQRPNQSRTNSRPFDRNSQDQPHFKKSTGAKGSVVDKGFAEKSSRSQGDSYSRSDAKGDGQNAVKRSGKFPERRNSSGKPI